MAGNEAGSSSRSGGPAIGAGESRFRPLERRSRWRGCGVGLSCFGSQKREKRIVPATRIPDGSPSANRANGSQPVGISNQNTTIAPSLLAPPSSPASFTNSALPSTVQSPSCFLSMSASSPGGPANVFATGPYAHETQLVSPPVFSTFTTEPSTAPLTPPPEAHLTTPSSPDVPYARFLSSSTNLKASGKENGASFASSNYGTSDLQATYPLYPESLASGLVSPVSGASVDGLSSSFTDHEFSQWRPPVSNQDTPPYPKSSNLFALDSSSKNFMLPQDSRFFCPATSAQFYLDQAQQSYPAYAHCGGRLSLSREGDAYNGGNAHQNRSSKAGMADAEEIEAYRASFGFSADEIISTPTYVEISDVLDDSFTITPFPPDKVILDGYSKAEKVVGGERISEVSEIALPILSNTLKANDMEKKALDKACNSPTESKPCHLNGISNRVRTSEDELISKMEDVKLMKRSRSCGMSISDAEVDYREGRSRKDGNRNLVWP